MLSGFVEGNDRDAIKEMLKTVDIAHMSGSLPDDTWKGMAGSPADGSRFFAENTPHCTVQKKFFTKVEGHLAGIAGIAQPFCWHERFLCPAVTHASRPQRD